MHIKIFFLILLFLLMQIPLSAQESEKKAVGEQDWGIGLTNRSASIPYSTDGSQKIVSIVPLIFYEGERFFVRGIGGGVYIYRDRQWQISALTRLHFVDLPDEYQNMVQPNNLDYGLQARYYFSRPYYAEVEPLLDIDYMFSTNIRFGADYRASKFFINPFAEIKIKSADYNTRYFGLTMEKVKWGMDYSLGVILDYRLFSNLYLYGAAKITLLDKNSRQAKYVRDDVTGEMYLGFGFTTDRTKPRKEELGIRPYIRLSHGWATPSAFQDAIIFNNVKDEYNNQLTSVFYGHPLTDEVLSIPVGIYITSGFVWHWPSSVQGNAQEIVLAIKAYFTIPWPIRWRIGGAEGFSYLNEIVYIEQEVYDRKNYESVNFLNYLDFSLDFNVGDIVGDQLNHIWLGYNVHHRSGIYEASQQYGRVGIGSNYYSAYLQYDF